MSKTILLTGAAGFIGFHTLQKLLSHGYRVVGLDSINNYYDVELKYGRLAETGIPRERISYGTSVSSDKHASCLFVKLCLEDREKILSLFDQHRFDVVCHLAAQAGVRYSIENPFAYIDSNIVGFMNILEACRRHKPDHLVYASSSSVYGLNELMPFATHHTTDHPVSLYGASKKTNELMAHSYSHLYSIASTGLRFFTVYGPWGRPDMALFHFTRAILEGRPIDVYGNGKMKRDFTYCGDIVEGLLRVIDSPPTGNPAWNGRQPDPSSSRAPYKIYNIGNNNPVALMDFIEALEHVLGKKAIKNMLPMQPGDVPMTWADTADLEQDFGYAPKTPIQEGIARFVSWYKRFYDL